MERSHTPRLPALAFLSLLLLALPGCDERGSSEVAEAVRDRELAARRACVAAEVLRRASDDVSNLEETIASTGDESPGADITRRAGMAALQFARAYEQHATLRMARYARIDSAYNYARRTADSIRHMEIAQQLTISTPEPETIEGNVIAAYERDLSELAGDPDHPCNWDVETR